MTLKEKIANNRFVAGIIGLGYVGLPLMHSICRSGAKVVGFDIDQGKADQLNAGKSYLDTVPAKIIKTHRDSGLFEATTDFSKLAEVDVIIICVPTPLDQHREPDLSYVVKTVETIAETLRPEQLVVLESTTYPGTLQDVVKPILEEKTKLTAGKDFYLAFSPEREDPGNPNFETSTIPKVVGADSDIERELAVNLYSRFVDKVVPVSTSHTAEAVKITENIFRAVNIALVNELKIIYAKMGIDVWEVVEAAKTKPFGYMPFYPGPGLGGHCIPIDPFYLTWKAREVEVPTRFIELAGEINTAMPKYVVEQTANALSAKKKKALNGSKILVIGLAYKKNINDQRESPTFPIMEMLDKQGAVVDFYDPYIPEIMPTRHYPKMSGRKSIEWKKDDLKSYDAIMILTDHDNVAYEDIAESGCLVIDTRNAIEVRGIKSDNILKA
ncbi:MAG TPA: nucleotide sugar dehydrogenase [Emcibacteraceae bacterium]|nr:nucleotide sugar dehydrogenase [Emcibacteraceae bacterium]